MSEGLGVPGCPGCERLQRRVDALEERISKLEAALEESRRAGKRQAAPFSKGAPKAEPKKPGRKEGEDYGRAEQRGVPKHVDEILAAPLLSRCVVEDG